MSGTERTETNSEIHHQERRVSCGGRKVQAVTEEAGTKPVTNKLTHYLIGDVLDLARATIARLQIQDLPLRRAKRACSR